MRSSTRNVALAAAAIGVLASLNALGSVGRPYWMDEAITIIDFVSRPDFLSVYLNYVIPNNQILFTEALRLHLQLSEALGCMNWCSYRIPSLVFGVAAAALLCVAAARKGGLAAGFWSGAFFALSATFALYASAVRGYMLATLLSVCAALLAEPLARKGGAWRFAAYFIICVLAVGTIPTNAIALEAVALTCLPLFMARRKERLARTAFLFLAPPAALAAFYLPILPNFVHCLTLGEGWGSAFSATWDLYAVFCASFLPLLAMAALGAVESWRARPAKRLSLGATALILALPLPFLLLGKTTPFPRVFLPLWPLWLVALAPFVGIFLSKLKSRFPKLKIFMAVAPLFCVWSVLMINGRPLLEDSLFGGGLKDDLLLPHYAQASFRPDLAAKELAERAKETPSLRVAVSFEADPYAMALYCSLLGAPPELLLYDSPRKKIPPLSEIGGPLLLLCANDEDFKRLAARVGIEGGELALDLGAQRLYVASGKAKP